MLPTANGSFLIEVESSTNVILSTYFNSPIILLFCLEILCNGPS